MLAVLRPLSTSIPITRNWAGCLDYIHGVGVVSRRGGVSLDIPFHRSVFRKLDPLAFRRPSLFRLRGITDTEIPLHQNFKWVNKMRAV